MRMGRTIAIAVLLCAWSASAGADDRFRLRVAGAGGLVVSTDQWQYLSLDQPVVEGQLRLAWMPLDELALEAVFSGGAFFASEGRAGALIDAGLGAEVGVDAGVVRPWIAVHLGAGVTGTIVVPVLRVSIGIDGRLSDEIGFGPVLAFGNAFYEDGPPHTNDAQFFTLGVSFTYSPAPTAPTPRPAPPPPHVRPRAPVLPIPPPVDDEVILSLIDEAAGIGPRELLVPVLFDFDSVDIVACSAASLHALREYLGDHAEIRTLEIEGNADASGDAAHNEALSRRRAEAIRAWLVERGVEEDRLTIAAHGERAPVEGNDSDDERQQNRRARFRVLEED
jgi:outer membrane protein OmpA-like peptidoglycan-associated protein